MSALSGYFDHNATTPMSEAARQAWLETSERFWQNPSSLYREAGAARQVLEDTRESLADLLGIDDPERVIFTSGATEANNSVIRYFAETLTKPLAVAPIEHPCVAAPVDQWLTPERKWMISVQPESGVIELDEVMNQIRSGQVGAVSVMAANNETGVCQPWEPLAALCQEHGVIFHSDAAQWFGKKPVAGLGDCGFLTGSGHKFGGGKGVGFLVIPEGEAGAAFLGMIGGPQEAGRRAGTEDLPAIAAMVAALSERDDEAVATIDRQSGEARDAFEAQIGKTLSARVLGQGAPRLGNTSMFVLPHTKNLKWLIRLSARGFCVSTGSACSAGKGNPSAVMAAMGLDFDEMSRVIRVSAGPETAEADWQALAAALEAIGGELSSG